METVTRKSMLYKSGVEFEDYALNHVQGCTHDCKYPCYARLIKKVKAEDWKNVKLVNNALDLLDKEIPKFKNEVKQVHLCFSTDPFMYNQPDVIDLSLKIIDKLLANNINIKVLTKGILPNEIIDIEKKYNPTIKNHYGISLVNTNEDFRQKYEPGASSYVDRIQALRNLNNGELYTYVYMEPFNPINITLQEFKSMLDNINFTNKIYYESWQYNKAFANGNNYTEYYNYLNSFCITNNIELKVKEKMRNKLEKEQSNKLGI